VEDGGDLTLLGKFCGENIPPPLLALSGVVIIKFHSDKNVIRKGFLAVFNDSQDCVYVKKDGNGFIRSPNFPTTYPQEILCFYYIESVNKIPINITFTSFDLEHTSIGTCDRDYIRVNDGISKSAKLLGTFCGKQIPFLPVIYSGSVFLILRSNNLISGQGFSAEYKEEAFLDCSGYLNAVSGRIQSPNYPENYNRNTDCEYRIVSPYNESSINLTFLHFELEKQIDCDYDFVEIYDLNQRIGRFCGTQNPVLTFTLSSSIRVVFHSDYGRNFKGFYATFTQITDYQTTEELPSTLSFSTMSNTTFKPSLNSASDNTVVIGGAIGVIIGMAVVFIVICVIIGRQRRTGKNQLGRKCS
ncbi:tolloid, partial [Mytilus galloprovincialis]